MSSTAPTTSLYERLGGEAAVQSAVVLFYEKILADPSLAPFFAGLDMDKQINKQIAFMTMAFGGPHAYGGRELREAHSGLVKRGLTDEHFDRVASLLSETLAELGVDPAISGEALSIVAGTRHHVLSRQPS